MANQRTRAARRLRATEAAAAAAVNCTPQSHDSTTDRVNDVGDSATSINVSKEDVVVVLRSERLPRPEVVKASLQATAARLAQQQTSVADETVDEPAPSLPNDVDNQADHKGGEDQPDAPDKQLDHGEEADGEEADGEEADGEDGEEDYGEEDYGEEDYGEEDYGEEDYEEDYGEEDCAAEVYKDAIKEEVTCQPCQRPPREQLFNTKCWYYHNDVCTKQDCRFLHDEAPCDVVFYSSVQRWASEWEASFVYYDDSTPTVAFEEDFFDATVSHAPYGFPYASIYVGNLAKGCNKTFLRGAMEEAGIDVLFVKMLRSVLSNKHRAAFVHVPIEHTKRAVDIYASLKYNGVELYAHVEFTSIPVDAAGDDKVTADESPVSVMTV